MPSNSLLFKVSCLYLIAHLLSCCSGCICENECSYTELASIEVSNLDNAGQTPIEPISDTLDALSFMLEIKFHGKAPVQSCSNVLQQCLRSLSNPALAMKCSGPVFLSPDTLRMITIQSTADFNENYPAGSDLSALFEAEYESAFDSNVFFRYETFDSTAYWPPQRFARYYLFSTPDEIQTHRFIVTATLKNGVLFSDTTSSICLR
jgi:hypothetical protein